MYNNGAVWVELTEEDVAMESGVLGWASTNVRPPLLPISEVAPGDVEYQPVSPLSPLGVTPTGGIGVWKERDKICHN